MISAIVDLSPQWMPSLNEIRPLLERYIKQLRRFVGGRIVLLGADVSIPDIMVIDTPVNFRFPNLLPILQQTGIIDDIIVISPGVLYADDLSRHIEDFQYGNERARLVYAQPGSEHIIANPCMLQSIPDIRISVLPHIIRRMARNEKEVKVEIIDVPGRNAYLKLDLPEGRRFLADNIDKPRFEWEITIDSHQMAILNREKVRWMVTRLGALVPLEDKIVLEVGASVEHPMVANMLLEEFGVRDYTGINIEAFRYSMDRADARVMQKGIYEFKPERKHHLIFSFSVLEHVPDPIRFLKLSPNWLTDGGLHYGIFQVWSSAKGHHISTALTGYEYVDDFDHLTHDLLTMRSKLEQRDVPSEAIDEIVNRMFSSSYINRERAKNILNGILTCGLEPIMIDTRNHGRYHRGAEFVDTGGEFTIEELSITGFDFLLRKSEIDWRAVADESALGRGSIGNLAFNQPKYESNF